MRRCRAWQGRLVCPTFPRSSCRRYGCMIGGRVQGTSSVYWGLINVCVSHGCHLCLLASPRSFFPLPASFRFFPLLSASFRFPPLPPAPPRFPSLPPPSPFIPLPPASPPRFPSLPPPSPFIPLSSASPRFPSASPRFFLPLPRLPQPLPPFPHRLPSHTVSEQSNDNGSTSRQSDIDGCGRGATGGDNGMVRTAQRYGGGVRLKRRSGERERQRYGRDGWRCY